MYLLKVLREVCKIARIRAFFLRVRVERELNRKANPYRFQIKRGLKAFNDWPA